MTRPRAHVRAMRWLRALTLRTLALFALAIVASIAFALIAAEMRHGALDALDRRLELAMHRLDSIPCDVVMQTATWIGANVILLPALAATIALAIRARRRVVAIVLVIDAAVVIAAYSLLKVMFARERPQLFDKIALPTGYSFPSGHSMSAMGIWGVIAAALIVLYPKARRRIAIGAALLIALIGLSRIYLGAHWPSDVLGGLLGGVPPLIVSVHLMHRRPRQDASVADLVQGEPARHAH